MTKNNYFSKITGASSSLVQQVLRS